jgi:hypothetical protein
MAISKIAGQMLKDTLERDGANLAISDTTADTPVIFVDIVNSRVGIDNSTPAQALDIVGNVIANNLFSSNTVSATGNITGGNVLTVALDQRIRQRNWQLFHRQWVTAHRH